MKEKPHDISGNVVKISYPMLLRCAAIAWGGARTAVERNLSAIQERTQKSLTFEADQLVANAENLAIAIKTHEALIALETREQIEWIELPKTEENS